MGDSLTQVIAWRSVVPITMGMITIAMIGWLSNYWAQMAAQRTARVLSRISARRPGVFRR
jgi:hypothetical protein